jgi:hypothetical protein
MDQEGVRNYTFGKKDREIGWFGIEEIEKYLEEDVNQNQIARLSSRERRVFLDQAQESMEYFDYL